MTDPYRLIEAHQVRPDPPSGVVRPVLWLLLAISAAGSMVTSSTGNVAVGVTFGVATLCSAVALAVHHYQNRRR